MSLSRSFGRSFLYTRVSSKRAIFHFSPPVVQLMPSGLVLPSWVVRENQTNGKKEITNLSFLGAAVMRQYQVTWQAFKICKIMAEELVSDPDINLTMPLILMGASAYQWMEPPEADNLGRSWVLAAKSMCEALGYINCEVTKKQIVQSDRSSRF